MKQENQTILLQSMYIILGLTCFMIVLTTTKTWAHMYPEASVLIRVSVLIGLLLGILISIVSTSFGKFAETIYNTYIKKVDIKK